MPAPRDVDKELGKGPLTSKAMKRRNKWEHREGKRKRWDGNSRAWNIYLSMLKSDHLCEHVMSVWCLWDAALSCNLFWLTISSETPRSLFIFHWWLLSDLFHRLLSSHGLHLPIKAKDIGNLQWHLKSTLINYAGPFSFTAENPPSPYCRGYSAGPWLNEICKQQHGDLDIYNEYDYSRSCIFITHAPPCEVIFLIGSKAISSKALKNYPFPVFISWYQRNDYLKHNQQEGIGFLLLSSHCYSFRSGGKTPQGNTVPLNILSE